MPDQDPPAICDYEGSTYRTDFWEGQGRDYEDRVERVAIQRLLPPTGKCLIEVGAGFGRLADLYSGYQQIVLFDYSHSQLVYAREKYGDAGFLYVAGDLYRMPFAPGVFDTALMVRVLHHMQAPLAALASVRTILHHGGTFLLEFANKRNLKAIVRWLAGRQQWNPFTQEPVEFVELNYDFHPRYVRETLAETGFHSGRMLTVSHFRVGLFKRTLPTGLLVTLDSVFQPTGALWQLTPSVFVRNQAVGDDETAPEGVFWRCPTCRAYSLSENMDGLTCGGCGAIWPKREGIYDFKPPEKNR